MGSMQCVFPTEILAEIFKFSDPKEWTALNQVNKKCYDIVLKLMIKNAKDIYSDSKKQHTTFFEFIKCRFNLIKSESYLEYSSFYQDVVKKALYLDVKCAKRMLSSDEVYRLNIEIENRGLEQVWPRLGYEISQAYIQTNPGRNAPPIQIPDISGTVQAKEIRAWLQANPNLLRNVCLLRLGREELKLLPPEIGLFSSVQRLCIYDNHITILPIEIGSLNNLTQIDAENNDFKDTPEEIKLIRNLTGHDFSRKSYTKRNI